MPDSLPRLVIQVASAEVEVGEEGAAGIQEVMAGCVEAMEEVAATVSTAGRPVGKGAEEEPLVEPEVVEVTAGEGWPEGEAEGEAREEGCEQCAADGKEKQKDQEGVATAPATAPPPRATTFVRLFGQRAKLPHAMFLLLTRPARAAGQERQIGLLLLLIRFLRAAGDLLPAPCMPSRTLHISRHGLDS
ncbi:hypothetical protein AB1Y20_011621 [Prymnesium parvum]|uniref:Uncharacterized protein n=1 Tax=Prymnesium parvum TaxID=97485 RepID=A0AB34IIL0_PRYPA